MQEIRGVGASPAGAVVLLMERAVAHLVNVSLRPNDSEGPIRERAAQLLDLHADVADLHQLARWMVRFGFEHQGMSPPTGRAVPARSASAVKALRLVEITEKARGLLISQRARHHRDW
ncbi:MAG: hypothetical protein WBU92_06660 [Candidatus Dormiibacterota bacterium]